MTFKRWSTGTVLTVFKVERKGLKLYLQSLGEMLSDMLHLRCVLMKKYTLIAD